MNRMIGQGATLLLSTCCVVLLGSCGSGAVSAPPAPDPAAGTPLTVSPPTAVLFPDLPTTFTITCGTGGISGFTVFSSNSAALPIAASVTGSTFTVVANSVTADTAVDITVRDAANAAATVKTTIKPSSLLNQITFTPFGPTATGCGTNALCSGGDAQIVVKAIQNGVVLRNRSIRFDAFKGDFQLVVLATGEKVSSLLINTDEQGEATARITANVGAATQVATIQTTDVSVPSGVARRYNFTIVQQVSGAGILSTLPSAGVTITGPKGATSGADGTCLIGAMVDYYVYGGTPPYTIASPLTGVATVASGIVGINGGRFTASVTGCGTVAFIVTDASGRTIETSSLESIRGATGATVTPTATVLTVSPLSTSVSCGVSGTVSLAGSGTFTANIVTAGVLASAFNIKSDGNQIPNTLTLTRVSGTVAVPTNAPTTIIVNIVAGSTIQPVMVATPATCP